MNINNNNDDNNSINIYNNINSNNSQIQTSDDDEEEIKYLNIHNDEDEDNNEGGNSFINNRNISNNSIINGGGGGSASSSSDLIPILQQNNNNHNSSNNDDDDEIITITTQKETNAKKVRKHIIGSILILIVVSLWVASSILTQIIFEQESFDKPFFLTYFNTSIFSFYLFGYFINWKKWTSIPISNNNNNNIINNNNNNSINTTSEQSSPTLTAINNINNKKISNYKFSLKQILRTSLILAPFWFVANYTYNLSLDLTSVSTNTILSTLSGIFSLALSILLKVDKFSIEKLFATLLTLSGVILVTFSDFNKDTNGNDTMMGSILAIIGAFLYGLYSVLVKKLIGKETNLPMAMMFGFLGFFNLIFLWPIFLILNLIGYEVFQLPTTRIFLFLLFNGLFGFVSDLLDSYAVVMTSPVISSIGLSLSIPFAMISDFIRSGKKFTVMYLFGSIFVVLGFLIANLASQVFENKLKSIENKLFQKVKSLFKRD